MKQGLINQIDHKRRHECEKLKEEGRLSFKYEIDERAGRRYQMRVKK